MILSNVRENVRKELTTGGVVNKIGEANVLSKFSDAVEIAKQSDK